MKIRITVSGHKHWQEFVGEVISFGSTVEPFGEGVARQNLQVPCVVVRVEGTGNIIVQPLREQLYDIKCQEIVT